MGRQLRSCRGGGAWAKVFRRSADKPPMAPPASIHHPISNQAVTKPQPRFVARQPILTCDQKVFGYELLFRQGVENYFESSDSEAASRSVLESSTLMGFEMLCDGRRAFINCTRELLLSDYITLLPPAQTVVEVLETVPADELVVKACRRLKDAGYLIALDDFTVNDPRKDLIELADIIKVDLRLATPEQNATLVKRYRALRRRMLAEKVETIEEFTSAKKAGFLYFQGYFFRRPEMLATSKISTARMSYLRMLQAASRSELDLEEVESVIKTEVSLCYRLLRYLNSTVFALSNEIHSVRHALSLLGEREVRRWVRLVATLAAGQNKPSDLVLSALVRARFCELLSPKIQMGDSDLFLMGLLSLMDVILEIPMPVALENIPLHQDCKEVLLGKPSRLRPFYQLMLHLEAGEWQAADELAKELRFAQGEVAEAFWQAMHWAKEVSS
jgi:c-di-GMP-related signal transduction protein